MMKEESEHTSDCIRAREEPVREDFRSAPLWPVMQALSLKQQRYVLSCPHWSHDAPKQVYRALTEEFSRG